VKTSPDSTTPFRVPAATFSSTRTGVETTRSARDAGRATTAASSPDVSVAVLRSDAPFAAPADTVLRKTTLISSFSGTVSVPLSPVSSQVRPAGTATGTQGP
jgi:hypothetical protein